MAHEVKGGKKELEGLKGLCPTVTGKKIVCPTVKHAGIKDRLHWTILSLIITDFGVALHMAFLPFNGSSFNKQMVSLQLLIPHSKNNYL